MAKKVEIDVEIDARGNVRVHVSGAKGKGCLEYERMFAEALGTVVSHELTAEYHEQEHAGMRAVTDVRKRTSP